MNRRLIITILVAAVFIPTFAQAEFPAGCTSNGLGISITPSTFIAHVGDTVTFTIVLSLPSATDCGVKNGIINFTYPNGTIQVFDGSITLNASSGDPRSKTFVSGPYTLTIADGSLAVAKANSSATSQTPIAPQPATASAQIGVTVIHPNTTLIKTANPTTGTAPLTVTYTYNESNTGDVNLTSPSVTDDSCSPVDPVLSGSFNVGDTNTDGILNPGEIWKFTCTKTYSNSGTFTNTAIGNGTDPLGRFITYPAYPSERAQATVTVNPPTTPGCQQGGECKVTGWGLIGPKTNPEKKFQIFASSAFIPKGNLEVQDYANGKTIKGTNITSVVTDKSVMPKTGTIKGFATVNGAGPYPFTVNVWDAADPSSGLDVFEILIPAIPYSNKGNVSFGDVQVVK